MANTTMPSFPGSGPKPKSTKTAKKKGKKETPKAPEGFKCTCCGTVYPKREGNFLTSSSFLFDANKGYVPICKACTETYYAETLMPLFDFDDDQAMEVMCAMFDWYYSDYAMEQAKKAKAAKPNGVLCSIFSGQRRLNQIQKRGQSYRDTIVQRREAAKEAAQAKCVVQVEDIADEEPIEIPQYIVKMFGHGYTPDEYEYLQDQYEDWLAKYEINTKALEQCIQALCVSSLNIRRAQQANDPKATQVAMKSFQEMLSTARLAPRQHKDDTIVEEETFGTLIKKWEDEKPVPKPEGEFADVDGIRKLVTVFFFGHLCKMFNIKNDYAELYEAEIAKNTVLRPQQMQEFAEDDTDIADALFRDAREAPPDAGIVEDGG